MATASDLFDDISELLSRYCDAPDVVIRVDMDFTTEPFALKLIRHVRDPDNLFDNSGDVQLHLSQDEAAFVRSKAEEYFAITQTWEDKQINTTVTVYQDGTWNMGGSSRKR